MVNTFNIDDTVNHKGVKKIVHSILGPELLLLSNEEKTDFKPFPISEICEWIEPTPEPVVEEKKELTTEERDLMIQEFLKVQGNLVEVRDAEMECRLATVAALFNNKKLKGSQNIELANDFKFRCKKTINFKLANKEGETIKALAKLPREIANALVTWTPKISESAYKVLLPEHKAIIDEVLTTKPGTPSLELVIPKSAK